MLSENSVLKRLPSNIDRRQMVFLDGTRHAVEIAALAYERLQRTLTDIARGFESGSDSPSRDLTAAFLDAWAFVDAIDRFRSLVLNMPGVINVPSTDDQPGFRTKTEPLRKIRNIADHLHASVDRVIAKKSAALGVLTWRTILDLEKPECLTCAIIPGTVASSQQQLVNPAATVAIAGTSQIHLAVGEYRVCLSDVVPEVARVVIQIEDSLEQALANHGLTGKQAGADLLIAMKGIIQG